MGGEPGIYERMCKASAGEERPDAQGHKESSRRQTREPPVEVRILAFLTLSTLILPLLPPSLPFSLLFFFPRLSSTYYVTTREE